MIKNDDNSTIEPVNMSSNEIIEPHIHLIKSILWKGYRFRPIFCRLHYRPKNETFHEFILSLLLSTYGENWRLKQINLPGNEKRHIIIDWVNTYNEWKKANHTTENQINEVRWGAIASGTVKALYQFAYDIYCLQVINKLQDMIVDKIKDARQFQGARYEIAVAAIIARAGFTIKFLDDKKKDAKQFLPHCEFIATNKYTGEEIAVEAKSLHHKGTLNEKGVFDPNKNIRNALKRHINDALKQAPQDKPYLIFIDLNLPINLEIPIEQEPWFDAIQSVMNEIYNSKSVQNPFNSIIFTNFSYYYMGNAPCREGGEYLSFISPQQENIIHPENGLTEVFESLKRYSYIPDEV